MSIDAGGVAQMTYQPQLNSSLGASGPGFGSRGKANHIKRLSVAPPSKISPIDETQQVNAVSTPRTARGHLLAGLRTAPKSATVPASNTGFGLESSRYASSQYAGRGPQTTTAASFPNNPMKYSQVGNATRNANRTSGNFSAYSLPEHVLAPPQLDFNLGGDQSYYDELIATNTYLAQQQRALQQQLLNVQQAAQQLGGMGLNNNNSSSNLFGGMQQTQQSVTNPAISMYTQQFQQGLQPVVQPVPGSPGLFSVYNPMTGQSSYVVDNSALSTPQHQTDIPARASHSMSPPLNGHLNQRRQSPDNNNNNNNTVHSLSPSGFRSRSPPKPTPSPQQQEVEPLPPPSANAFRRGHKKNLSSVNVKPNTEWTRAGAGPKSAGIPSTPMTGTFGPGQGRAGEHPVRQPKGPPLIQELEEKPTAKHEGSKNFATRQRRRAVHDLVRAGRERTENRQPGSGTGSPGSEGEFNFSVTSDSDEGLARSSTLSNRPSLGSLRAAANGAIGSERKDKSRERRSVDSNYSTKSLSSSDEGNDVGSNVVPVEDGSSSSSSDSRRRTPLLVLSSAEKRKSTAL